MGKVLNAPRQIQSVAFSTLTTVDMSWGLSHSYRLHIQSQALIKCMSDRAWAALHSLLPNPCGLPAATDWDSWDTDLSDISYATRVQAFCRRSNTDTLLPPSYANTHNLILESKTTQYYFHLTEIIDSMYLKNQLHLGCQTAGMHQHIQLSK